MSIFIRLDISIAPLHNACQTMTILKIHVWLITRKIKIDFLRLPEELRNRTSELKMFLRLNMQGKVCPPSGRMKTSRVSEIQCEFAKLLYRTDRTAQL